MKFFSLVLLLLISQGVFAQTKPLDNGRVDSLIKSHVDNPPTNDYYILTFTSALVSTTLTPQIIREIKSINKIRKEHEEVLLIVKNKNIIPTNLIKTYYTKLFNLSEKDLQYIRIVHDDILVNELNQSVITGDAVSMFVHQGRLMYKSDAKWYYIHNTPLPHNQIIIDSIDRKVLHLEGHDISLASPIFNAADGQIMLLRDTDKDVFLLDPKTGGFKKVIDTKDYSAPDIFCNYFVPDSSSQCITAISEQGRLEKIKRIQFDIMTAYYDGFHYYFNVTLQIVEVLQKKNKTYQDDGKKKIYKPNEYYVGTYCAFLKTDKDFKNPSIFIDDKMGKGSVFNMEYANYDGGFLVKNDTFYFKKMFWPFYPIKRKVLQIGTVENSKMIKGKKSLLKFSRKELIYDAVASETEMITYKGRIIFKPSLSKYYYDFQKSKPIGQLNAFGINGVKPIFANNAKKSNDIAYSNPYSVRNFETVLNGEYLACLYQFNNTELFLEIKDSTFTTISTIDLNRFNQTPKRSTNENDQLFRSTIQDDNLYIFTVEDDEYVLYSYHFKESLEEATLSKQEMQAQKNKKE